MDDTEDVELLALVLVNTFDLNVEECCWVDSDASRFFDVLGKS